MHPVPVAAAVRTAIARRHGGLSGWHPVDLLAEVLGAAIGAAGLDPVDVDAVIVGCATPVGAQADNVARNAVLAAGWPRSVAATTTTAGCLSSLDAIVGGVARIGAGQARTVVVAGVDMASVVPPGAATVRDYGRPASPALSARFAGAGGLLPPGVVAERVALTDGRDRAALDAAAHASRVRANAAQPGVLPIAEIVRDRDTGEVRATGRTVERDELAEPHDSGAARPLHADDGMITAAMTAPAADGAAALVLATSSAAPVSVRSCRLDHGDPLDPTAAALRAALWVLADDGRSIDSIGHIEVSETLAPVYLRLIERLGVDLARVNPGGGALSRGHVAGAAALIATVDATAAVRDPDGAALVVIAGLDGAGGALILGHRRSPKLASVPLWLAVVLAIVLGVVVIRVGAGMLVMFRQPLPPPPPPGELRRVKITYRCSICGTEVRMTVATDEDPDPPRHCQDEMDLVAPID